MRVKYVQNYYSKTQRNVIDTVLVPLFWALNIFHALLWCFPCWLWTSNCRLGSESYHISIFLCMHIIQPSLTIFSIFTQSKAKQFSIFLCSMFYFQLKTFAFIINDVFEKSNEQIFSFRNCKINEKKISRSV